MRNFGKRLILFSIPAFLFFISIFVFYNYSKDIVDLKLKELSSYECLLMGDSQIQRLDGNLLGYNSSNIASSGEHYFFT